jgi:hypothetical protein
LFQAFTRRVTSAELSELSLHPKRRAAQDYHDRQKNLPVHGPNSSRTFDKLATQKATASVGTVHHSGLCARLSGISRFHKASEEVAKTAISVLSGDGCRPMILKTKRKQVAVLW